MDEPSAHTRRTYDAIGGCFLENSRDRSALVRWLDWFGRELPPGALVLDVGAGPGLDSAELRRRGLRALGLDLSLGMLRAGARDAPGPRLQADARRLPIASNSVAAVWANASLLHLSRDDAALALGGLRRVLIRDGLLFVSVKHGVGAEWESARYGRPRFFQYWTPPELDALLDRAGFRVLDAATQDGPRNTWLVRLAAARVYP
jgi:SAM-dependent methyltransferase